MSKSTVLILAGIVLVVVAVLVTVRIIRGNPRDSIEFHVNAVRESMRRVRGQMDIRTDGPGMNRAIVDLDRALRGLPERVRRKAQTNVEQRVKQAEEVRDVFNEVRESLARMDFEYREVEAAFDRMEELLKQVEGKST